MKKELDGCTYINVPTPNPRYYLLTYSSFPVLPLSLHLRFPSHTWISAFLSSFFLMSTRTLGRALCYLHYFGRPSLCQAAADM
jgi:hypothetical protein